MHSNRNKQINANFAKSPLALALSMAASGAMADAPAVGEGAMCIPENTYTVTSHLSDSSEGTLNEAINLANDDGGCSQIEFDEGISSIEGYTSPQITADLNIVGPGPDALNISGDSKYTIYAEGGLDETTSGDLYISNISLSGSGGTAVRQLNGNLTLDNVLLDENNKGIEVSNAPEVVVRNSTISNTQNKGAIDFSNDDTASSLFINNSAFVNNSSAGNGAGLQASIEASASIVISDSTFSGNTSDSSGEEDGGGAIYISNNSDLEGTIQRTTISGNASGNRGGGIYINNSGDADINIEQATLSGNDSRYGGGVCFNDNGGTTALSISSSSIVKNTTQYSGSGIKLYGSNNNVTIENSVIALNTSRNSTSGYVNLDGVFNSIDYSWIGNNNYYNEDGSVGSDSPVEVTNSLVGSIFDGDDSTLNLGDLADNGGPTQTHLPLEGSVLLEAGNPDTEDLSATDQRGANREVGALDIGAVERQTSPVIDMSQVSGDLTQDLAEAFSIDLNDITPDPYATIEVTGLPDGLVFDAATGIISGISNELGAFELTITVSNLEFSDSDALELYVKMAAPVVDTSSIIGALSVTTGETISINISTISSDENVTFAVSGLPTSLSFDTETKIISGTVTEGGTSALVITVSNTDYETKANVNLTATTNTPILNTDTLSSNLSIATGETIELDISGISSISGVTFGVTGLPDGIEFNAETNIISGTSNVGGTFALTITATHFDVTATSEVNLIIETEAPVLDATSILSELTTTAHQEAIIDLSSISDSAVTLEISGLPDGLVFNAETATISGTATQSGTYEITITASQFDASTSAEVDLVVQAQESASSSSNGLGSFGYGWLLMLAGFFVRRKH